MAARVDHVRKHHRRPKEDVIVAFNALVNAHVVLDLHVVTQPCSGHHHDVLAEAASLANDGPRVDVAEVPDLRVLPDLGALIDVARDVHGIAARRRPHFAHVTRSSRENVRSGNATSRPVRADS
jgi:hypothetical protein